MLVKFQDSQGIDIVDTVNIGANNSIVVNLVITGDATPITGKVFKNSIQIGEYTWTVAEGKKVVWYMGTDQPIYINNGDILKAVTTSPTYPDVLVKVIRSQPDLDNIVDLAEFVEAIRPMASASTPVSRIRLVIDQIALNAGIVYSQRTPVNVANIKAYVMNELMLPNQSAYVYGDEASLNNALTTMVPPTLKQIFETWDRFIGNQYYDDPATIPPESDVSLWYWDDVRQAAVMPKNTGLSFAGFNGFISDEEVEFYDHDVTFTSPNADDDYNGVVMAFRRVGNANHILAVQVCNDANQSKAPADPGPNLTIKYNYTRTLTQNNGNDVRTGWRGRTKRIKVVRRGDKFTVYASNWSEPEFNLALTMTLDLADYPELNMFVGAAKYGYCNASQPDSSFGSIIYTGGLLRDIIIDALNNKVYRYVIGTGWQILTGATAQDIYGSPRRLTNPDDGKTYQLNKDGTITII